MRNVVNILVIVIILCTVNSYAQDDWELRIVGGVVTYGEAQAVANSGNYAFVADTENGLVAFNVADPTAPLLTDSFDDGGIVSDLVIEDSYAYLAHWSRGMMIVDISDPTDLDSTCSYNTPGTAIDIYKDGNYAYVADFFNGLLVLDVSDVSAISQAGYSSQVGAISVAAIDSTIYLGVQSLGLVTYSLADTASPTVRDYDEIANDCNDIVIKDNYLFLACGQAGMLIYDISDRFNPDSITAVNTSGSSNRIAIKDTIAYIADGSNGLVAVNIYDPTNPQVIQVMSTLATASGVGFCSDFVLVADRGMLLVVYYDDYTDIEKRAETLPSQLNLNECYPNPFNPSTKVGFELKEQSHVTLDVYDIQGRLIDKLVDGSYAAGSYTIEWNPGNKPTGMYFFRLCSNGQVYSAKALYLK